MVDLSFLNNTKKSRSSSQAPEHIVESAHKKAERIIEKAVRQSEDIVEQMDEFREQMEEEMQGIFKQAADKYLQTITKDADDLSKACDAIIPQIKTQYQTEVAKAVADFKTQLVGLIAPVGDTLQKELQTARQDLQKKMDDEFAAMKTELETYKKQKMQQVEEALREQVSSLAITMLGRTLSPTEQERLVSKALEKAKEDGILG